MWACGEGAKVGFGCPKPSAYYPKHGLEGEMTTTLERAARALALSYYEDDKADNNPHHRSIAQERGFRYV